MIMYTNNVFVIMTKCQRVQELWTFLQGSVAVKELLLRSILAGDVFSSFKVFLLFVFSVAGWRFCHQRWLWWCWSTENRKWWHLHAYFLQLVIHCFTQNNINNFDRSTCINLSIFLSVPFLVAFLFNWIGFFLSFCLTTSAAGRYGAISGFGLSLIKWILIVRVRQHPAAHT